MAVLQDDSTIGIFCKKLHHEYADAAMNPFYVAGQVSVQSGHFFSCRAVMKCAQLLVSPPRTPQEIKSAKMDKELGLIVSQWNSDSSAK